MANAKRNLVGAAVVAAVLFSGSQAVAADRELRSIVLHVDNYAQVSSDLLADAEMKASSIYAAAGIRTIWIDGDSDAASRDMSALHLHVRLLSREMSEKKIKADHVANNVMGQALETTRYAYIFTSRIADLASHKNCFMNDVLGKVLAHEVGHMMSLEHSARGIMNVDLDIRPTVVLHFSDAQAEAMRAKLVATVAAN